MNYDDMVVLVVRPEFDENMFQQYQTTFLLFQYIYQKLLRRNNKQNT